MKVTLPTPLVLALRDEYPGCLPDSEAVGDMVASIAWQHLALIDGTRRAVSDRLRAHGDNAPLPTLYSNSLS